MEEERESAGIPCPKIGLRSVYVPPLQNNYKNVIVKFLMQETSINTHKRGIDTLRYRYSSALWLILAVSNLLSVFGGPKPSFHALTALFETQGGIPNVPHVLKCFWMPLRIIGSLENILFAPITYYPPKTQLACNIK